MSWIALAVFIIFLYVRLLTYQCLWPIAGPELKRMCCKGNLPMVPLVKFRELATIAPKLFAIHSIMYFLIVMVGGAVAQINMGTELGYTIVQLVVYYWWYMSLYDYWYKAKKNNQP